MKHSAPYAPRGEAMSAKRIRVYCNGNYCPISTQCLRYVKGVKIAAETAREIDESFYNPYTETCSKFVEVKP